MLSLVGHGELVHSDKVWVLVYGVPVDSEMVCVLVYGVLADSEDDLLLVQTLRVDLDGVVYGVVVGLDEVGLDEVE